MRDAWRVLRLHLVLVGIFTIGRWVMGLRGVPYERGHHVFSLVMLTFLSAVFFGAFARRWRGYPLGRAALLGLLMGLSTQVVIFTSTVLAYLLDVPGYFNHPTALNAEVPLALGEALQRRATGLLAGSLFGAVLASVGWLLGALLPAASAVVNTAAPPPPLSGPLARPG